MRTTKRVPWVRVIATALMLAMIASPALAAPPAVPLESLSMQVQSANSAIIVTAKLGDSVALPAVLRVPIPSGAKPYWVGEIVGTDPAKDPKATYTVEKSDGYDLVVFTVKQARTGQVEITAPTAPAPGVPTSVSYDLPIDSKVALATLSIGLPAGATVSSSTAGLVAGQGADGAPVLRQVVQNPKVGTSVSGSVTYSVAAAPAGSAPSAPGSTADALALPLWILALALGGFFVGSLYRQRVRARQALEADDPEADDPGEDRFAEPMDDTAFDDDEPAPSRARRAKKSVTPASVQPESKSKAQGPSKTSPKKTVKPRTSTTKRRQQPEAD